jgi:hypothetical protein
MLIEGTTLQLPAATKDKPDQVLNLAEILTAEARQSEVAIVTPVKAPELLHLFNHAWLETEKLAKKLLADINTAKKEVEKRKATVLLYEAEAVLTKCGVDSTKDSRDAVVTLDPEYQALGERVDQLVAAREWLVIKSKAFENSYSSVKKIMGEDAYNMSFKPQSHISGGGSQRPFANPTPTTAPTPTTTPKQQPSGYGKSRYDR